MSYLDLFQRYGNPSREAEIRLTNYLLRPDTLRRSGWGQMEIDVITRTLAAVGLER